MWYNFNYPQHRATPLICKCIRRMWMCSRAVAAQSIHRYRMWGVGFYRCDSERDVWMVITSAFTSTVLQMVANVIDRFHPHHIISVGRNQQQETPGEWVQVFGSTELFCVRIIIVLRVIGDSVRFLNIRPSVFFSGLVCGGTESFTETGSESERGQCGPSPMTQTMSSLCVLTHTHPCCRPNKCKTQEIKNTKTDTSLCSSSVSFCFLLPSARVT